MRHEVIHEGNGETPFRLVSFFCGDVYYEDCAAVLAKRCKTLGIKYRISRLLIDESLEWPEICRLKVPFLLTCQEELNEPILWVDVDAQILREPTLEFGSNVDFAAFLRGARSIGEAHRTLTPLARTWSPMFMFFNNTEKAKNFLKVAAEIENKEQQRVTDDYILEEAYRVAEHELCVAVLPPLMMSHASRPNTSATTFANGESGNVGVYKSKVVQHVSEHSLRKAITKYKKRPLSQRLEQFFALIWINRIGKPKILANYANFIAKRGDKNGAIALLERVIATHPNHVPINHALIKLSCNSDRHHNALGQTCRKIIDGQIAGDKKFAESRLMRAKQEARAAQGNVAPEERPPLWWMEGPYPGNFGDVLNPYVVEKLSGVPPVFVDDTSTRNRIIAIGSTVRLARSGDKVWGAGSPRVDDAINEGVEYLAVRGPLTRDMLLRRGASCPEVYGDPALLLPDIYGPKSKSKIKMGLLRHSNHASVKLTIDKDTREFSILTGSYEAIEELIDDIYSCEYLASSSLHGLIVAHAYGIPALWIDFEDGTPISGDGTKFADYFLSIGVEPPKPFIIRDKIVASELIRDGIFTKINCWDKQKLLDSAPFELISKR